MLEYLIEGGPMMIGMVAASVIVFAVILDRYLAFKAAEDVDTFGLRSKIREFIKLGDIDGAIGECTKSSGPVAATLLSGLSKFRRLIGREKSFTEIESNVAKTMTDYSTQVIDTLDKRIGLLPMIGSLTPLLGMTGTVTGMINSFGAMSKSSALEATSVAAGISEALVNTASGLLIAMPAIIAYHLFSKRLEKIILEIDKSSNELIEQITLDYNPPAGTFTQGSAERD